MKNKYVCIMLNILVILFIVLTSCTPKVTPTPTASTPAPTASTPTPAEANWWDKLGEPQYGGTLNVRVASLDVVTFDPAGGMGSDYQYHLEELFTDDWKLDRDVWSFKTGFTPTEYHQGLLAESWEQVDPQTVTVHIREGVHWQDKPPVNGRELTAEDVQYNYDRMLGTGSGFTEPNPFTAMILSGIERVVATDRYTVQFKLKQPNAVSLFQVVNEAGPRMIPPEWVALGGDSSGNGEPAPGGPPGGGGPPPPPSGPLNDWRNAVGTGAWMVTDFVSGTSLTFSANPNYWGTDERHPENRIPYLESQKLVAIPDMSTAIAALRTGKIDMIAGDRSGPTWQQIQTLAKTNPEIQNAWWPNPASTIDLRCDHEPFTDIKVRKALQMAIDRQAIAENIYGGTVDGTPCGLISPLLTGWTFAYKDWPKELQEEYSYNPERARELLAEAGYPDGFETNIVADSTQSVELLQAAKSYFMDIGVDMEINLMDPGSFWGYCRAGNHDQMALASSAGYLSSPTMSVTARSSGSSGNFTHNNDPNFDELVNRFNAATTMDEARQLSVEIDRYAIEQHWAVCIFPTALSVVWQPWVKGYSGEGGMYNMWAVWRARMWIDQDVKASMGQ